MAKKNPIIPRKISEAVDYIDRTDDFLQITGLPVTNGARLGILPAVVGNWHTKRGEIDDLNILCNAPSTKTAAVVASRKEKIKDFRTFAKPVFNVIKGSPNATTDDALMFNVVLDPKNPSHRTIPITETCYPLITRVGLIIEFKCRTASDAKRGSLAEGADGVMLYYCISDTAPANPAAAAVIQVFFSKATFRFECPADSAKKNFYCWVKWVNMKNPAINGATGDMFTVSNL